MFKSKKQTIAKPNSFRTQYKWEYITTTKDCNTIIASTVDGKIVTFNSSDYTLQKEIQVSGYPTGTLAQQRVIGVLKSKNIEYDVEEMNEYNGNENFPIKEILQKYELSDDEITSRGTIKCIKVLNELQVVIGFNSTVAIIDLANCGNNVIVEEKPIGHDGMVRSLDVYKEYIISLANDRKICIWGMDNSLIKEIERTDEDEYYNTSFLTSNGDLLVSGSRQTRYANEKGDLTQVFEVAVYSLGEKVGSINNARFMKYFHHNRTSPHHSVVVSIIQLENGRIMTGSQDGIFVVWDENDYRCLFIKINSSQVEYTKLKQNCPVHCAVAVEKLLIVGMRDYMAAFDMNYREITPQRKPSEEKQMMPFGRYSRDITAMFVSNGMDGKYILYLVCAESGEIHMILYDPVNKPMFVKKSTISAKEKITSWWKSDKSIYLAFSSGEIIDIPLVI